MNGILVVNKPKNYTSRDIVNKLNNIFHDKRIGHTGTLDPIATGVLVVCGGKYTKLSNELTALNKEYIAEMKLGIKTDTGDITGQVLDKKDKSIATHDIESVFSNFPNEYTQTVPKYSAIKINGKKLYEYARQNESVNLPQKKVHIYSLEIISIEKDIIKFKANVSKGTYIRSLIEDIADKLGTYATMISLVRTKQGIFDIKNSFTIEDIENNKYQLLTIKDVFNYPYIEVKPNDYKLFKNGNKVVLDVNDGKYFIKSKSEVLAIYEFKGMQGKAIFML